MKWMMYRRWCEGGVIGHRGKTWMFSLIRPKRDINLHPWPDSRHLPIYDINTNPYLDGDVNNNSALIMLTYDIGDVVSRYH